jgi:hypothetical protein
MLSPEIWYRINIEMNIFYTSYIFHIIYIEMDITEMLFDADFL